MSQTLEKYPDFFPPLVAQMIAVGETTGKIEQIFQRLAGFPHAQIERVRIEETGKNSFEYAAPSNR